MLPSKAELNSWHKLDQVKIALRNTHWLNRHVDSYLAHCKENGTNPTYSGFLNHTSYYSQAVKSDRVPATNFKFNNRQISRKAMSEFLKDWE